MFGILLLAQLSAATPLDDHLSDVRGLFVADDVPSYLAHEGEVYRTVYTRTTVRDDGAFENCAIEISSGDKKLDAYTCALIAKRAKMHPVKWFDGSPVYSVLRFPVVWIVTSSPGPPERLSSHAPDLELTVDQLPKGAPGTLEIMLEVRVDATGKILACGELPPSSRDHNPHFPTLLPAVCSEATKALTPLPPVDRSGKSTRSVKCGGSSKARTVESTGHQERARASALVLQLVAEEPEDPGAGHRPDCRENDDEGEHRQSDLSEVSV